MQHCYKWDKDPKNSFESMLRGTSDGSENSEGNGTCGASHPCSYVYARRSGLCLSCKMPGFLLLLLAADLQVPQTGKHPQ